MAQNIDDVARGREEIERQIQDLHLQTTGVTYHDRPSTRHRRSEGETQGPCPPKFLAYQVILCFEKRRSEQKYCCSPRVKHFGHPKYFIPPKAFGLATPLVRSEAFCAEKPLLINYAK